jgi:hypothetical protein
MIATNPREGISPPHRSNTRVCRAWLPLGGWLLALASVAFAQSPPPAPSLIYGTSFEYEEGYTAADALAPLRGQMNWIGEGSGGNGLLTNFFAGCGQQAYVGYAPPALKDDFLNIWRPVGYQPPGPHQPVVKFSVLMQIVDSTNGQYDDFRWSAYNSAGSRLFSLDFDNSRAEIFYVLDDAAGFKSSGFSFSNDAIYELHIWMNFWRNNWLAIMNGRVVVDSQPLTTINARLDLSDVDAVWAIRNKGLAGDNYMLFDDYWLTIEPVASIPPVLETIGLRPDGQFELMLHGERGMKYAIDVSEDLVSWAGLATNAPPTGVWSFLDSTAPDYPISFYRARAVSP